MKKYILLLIIPFLSFGQDCDLSDLTYVPDDSFEEYLENNVPGASNGFQNDNYVITSALSPETNSLIDVISINLCPTTLSMPIFDLTGIENINGPVRIKIVDQLMNNIDLSCVKTKEELFQGWCYQSIYSEIYIEGCTLLESITLPGDSLQAIEITSCPTLNEIVFQDDLVMIGGAYGCGVGLGLSIEDCNNLCSLNIKGTYLSPPCETIMNLGMPTIGISSCENLREIDFSNISELDYGAVLSFSSGSSIYFDGPCSSTPPSTFGYGLPNLTQINFANNTYYWGSVFQYYNESTGNPICFQVDNPVYCELSDNWPSPNDLYGEPIINYSENCYNPTDCESLTEMIEMSITNKQLIKKIDILGRGTNQKGLNIEIYDDGSVEKKYVIE